LEKQKPTQRVLIIAAAVLALVMVPVLFTWATQPTYTVAYSGLDETDAGAIVEQLKTLGVSYKLQGTTILVPADNCMTYACKLLMPVCPKAAALAMNYSVRIHWG
jgi:flagellar M-ring protein FliF